MRRISIVLCFILLFVTSVNGRIIYVKPTPSGTGSGLSWNNAASLQTALGIVQYTGQYLETSEAGIAVSGDQIWAAKGIYKPTDGNDRLICFRMKNGVAVYGGFAGTETDLNQRNFSANKTILSGEIGTADSTDNSECIIYSTGLDSTAILDGLIISGAFQEFENSCGMYNENSSPTIQNCTFIKNFGEYSGGIDNNNSSPMIINCYLIGNFGGLSGGITCRNNSSPRIINCVFSGNYGNSGIAIAAGGITNIDSSPEIVNCTFSNNYSSTGNGNGIYNYNSSATVVNTIFWGRNPQISNENCSPNVTFSCIPGGYPGEGNISSDPCFVDAEGADKKYGTSDDDFRIKDKSRCIGSATSGINIPIVDITGYTRGTPADIGAYENSLSVPIPPLLIFVNEHASGSNNGTSWLNAYTALQPALDEASGGDVIWVARGTYKPTQGNDRTVSFKLKYDVEIYGGFAGDESNLNARNYLTNKTILSGDIGDAGIEDNSYNVIHNTQDLYLDSTAVLDGFTISGGNSNNTENLFQRWGGGMYNSYASPKIVNCTFSDNQAESGGGIKNEYSSPVIINCNFTGNHGEYGGGICNEFSSSPTLINCIFNGNTADVGGGIYSYSSSAIIKDCIFSNNKVFYNGGGIYNSESSLTINNSLFLMNSASEKGGGISNDLAAVLSISNCIFNGNSAGLKGGGIHNISNINPVISNCTFTGNTAPEGGGINNKDDWGPSSSPIVINSIFWGNNSQISGGEASNFTYCCIQDGSTTYTGMGNIYTDPLFADADGLDNIMGTSDDDLRLLNKSFCIGAGITGNGIPTADIKGITRGTPPDIGAYENYLNAPTIFVKFDASGINNGENWTDAYTSLTAALAASANRNNIWVAKGTYKPTTEGNRSISFQMKNGVKIYGGFAGMETSLTARNYAINETILSGDIGVEGTNNDNSYHVFFHPSSLTLDSTTVIDGFTITGGNASETDDPHNFGGGICNIGSSPKIINCTISGNYANEGSGVYNEKSSPIITGCSFNLNSAYSGGGIFNIYSSPSITSCTFNGNSASSGGGIYDHYSSSSVISGCRFINNSALYEGGGIYSFYSSSEITNCIIDHNSALAGGGLYSYYSSPKVINCTFSRNSAYSGGAASYYSSNTPMLKNSIFWGDLQSGTTNNSEIYFYNTTPDLIYCCIQNGDSGIYPGDGNIFLDPLFADASNGYFQLSAGSPCISAGLDPADGNYIPSYDITGRSRPTGNRTDIGAYEYHHNLGVPFEINSFSAVNSDGKVVLYWTTVTEANNYGFDIERAVTNSAPDSNSTLIWEKIGFVQGNGNSSSPKDYNFIDTNPPSGYLHYRLKQISKDGGFKYYPTVAEINYNPTDVKEKQIPEKYSLSQNYPNPFNPTTIIDYQIPVLSKHSVSVQLRVYDILGKEVAVLVNEQKIPGYYNVRFNGKNLSSGVYIYKIVAGEFTSTKKLILMK